MPFRYMRNEWKGHGRIAQLFSATFSPLQKLIVIKQCEFLGDIDD